MSFSSKDKAVPTPMTAQGSWTLSEGNGDTMKGFFLSLFLRCYFMPTQFVKI